MSDIKMSDMLILPVKRVNSGVMPFLKDDNDEVMFVGTRYHVDLCVTAINAYDANQERIKRQQKTNSELADVGAKILVGNSELKAQVELLHNTLDEFDRYNRNNLEYRGSPFAEKVVSSLAKSPQQCLADVRADAEKKGYWQGFETGSIHPSQNILMHYNGWLKLKSANERHAQ